MYEQELPEMPTLREDTENYNDRNLGEYQLSADQEAEPKRRSTDPEQQKKDKIWENIQKQVEEDDEEEVDSDANDSDPDLGQDSDDSQESGGEKNELEK
eukprot:CAMPEP_0205830570 /NCGR_PEP_ID=MMETSP0206-20130828/41435_1 /ASSEMBLY_ACC=CAM_ASM_000279 /TAXON_ID=36767 /ORGANISM="Euplotes focardii, Strain TN1" /LENGTH=98 /DNA_ID=CAMNT_0053134359 /DNA_START=264 /DNA_END=560 /DNA_ORIENTATION=-